MEHYQPWNDLTKAWISPLLKQCGIILTESRTKFSQLWNIPKAVWKFLKTQRKLRQIKYCLIFLTNNKGCFAQYHK